MKIFAISDLHISTTSDKPMDVFGERWKDYLNKIRADWREKVTAADVVLIPGDVSWAMKLPDAVKDIAEFSYLDGIKVIIRGNHDYWWNGIGKVREALPSGVYALQNDCVKFGNAVICGSRGWTVPGAADFKEHDEKIYLRESERLKLALACAAKQRGAGDKLIVTVHFPPFNARKEDNLFTRLFEENRVDAVVYGHLHGKDASAELFFEKNNVRYYLTSCDLVHNKLVEIKL